MALSDFIAAGPDLQEILIELEDWLELDHASGGPPDNFRARGFVEGMIKMNREGRGFSMRQEEAIIELYYKFDVGGAVENNRAFEYAISKDD